MSQQIGHKYTTKYIELNRVWFYGTKLQLLGKQLIIKQVQSAKREHGRVGPVPDQKKRPDIIVWGKAFDFLGNSQIMSICLCLVFLDIITSLHTDSKCSLMLPKMLLRLLTAFLYHGSHLCL